MTDIAIVRELIFVSMTFRPINKNQNGANGLVSKHSD